jgi:serine/threonine protein kinase
MLYNPWTYLLSFWPRMTGTAAYRAPEIILHEKCERGVDVWAFGIVMYIMLCGSHPFDLRGMV